MQLYKHVLIIMVLITSLFSCKLEPVYPARPTPVVTDTNYCKVAEEHLLSLSCEVAKPTKKEVVFEEFCKQTQQAGVFINPKCLSEVKTCEEVDVCTHSKGTQ